MTLTMIVMQFGFVFLAMPITIIGNEFTLAWRAKEIEDGTWARSQAVAREELLSLSYMELTARLSLDTLDTITFDVLSEVISRGLLVDRAGRVNKRCRWSEVKRAPGPSLIIVCGARLPRRWQTDRPQQWPTEGSRRRGAETIRPGRWCPLLSRNPPGLLRPA